MQKITGYFRSVKFAFGYSLRFVPKSTAIMAALYIGSGILPYANAFLLGRLVNAIVKGVGNGSYEGMWHLIFLYAFFGTLPTLFGNIQMYLNRQRMLSVQVEMDMDFLSHRERIDIANYENPEFLDLIERTSRNGLNPIQQLGNSQFDLMRALTSFFVGTFVSVTFSPWVYIAVIASAIPAFIMDIKYAGQSWSIWAKDSPEKRRLQGLRWHIFNRINLIETKLLQSRDKLLSWCRKIYEDFSKTQRNLEKDRVWKTSLADLIAFIGYGVGLLLVVRNVVEGQTSVGTLVYIVSALSSVRSSIANTLETVSGQYENSLLVQDFMTLFNTKPFIPESDNPIRLDLKSAPEIKFIDVGFKYPGSSTWTLRNLNLVFRPGDKIGLVGNNGAGKTTFVKLLCRIYDPTEGKILVNDVNLKNVSLKEWWSYLGVMFQEYSTYDFRVKESIAMGRPEEKLDMGKVKNSAQISQASSFIEEWKDKYDHQIGVEFKGIEPSKGQRQKLSIAKIAYRDAYLMILDEPTASVDAESEAKIFESLENLPKDKSALLISHDFSTISQCNQIFVLEKGELIESGDHHELMKKKGKYAELYNLQAERFKK
jgi:ATP-binding cassette, subfamily B, bacterial